MLLIDVREKVFNISRIRRSTSSATSSFSHPHDTLHITEQKHSHESTQADIAKSLRTHYITQTPTVLRQPYINADALYLWNNLNYLRIAVGEDVACDVEIGGDNYSNAERAQITFG
eukprot:8475927-Ditylum_brightwellii.AAC.1